MPYSSNSSIPPLYEALQHHDSIRLFQLLPSTSLSDKLTGRLITTRRASQPIYQALSYMWGPKDPTTERELEVNGYTLLLRANIHSALTAIREHRRNGRIATDTLFWIDLICIQQDCMKEKNHQVQQMGSIYTEAESVIIWLGMQTRLQLPDFQVRPLDIDRKSPIFSLKTKKFNFIDSTSSVDEENQKALFWALLNQHWTRTWILQEIGLANVVWIVTEDYIFYEPQIEQFLSAKLGLDNSIRKSWIPSDPEAEHPHTVAVAAIERFGKIWTVRQSRRDRRWKPLSLCTVVHQLSLHSECLEHRDKVYAVIGLGWQGNTIKVDYSIDEAIIFWDTIKITTMRRIDEYETEALKEALQLDWIRILTYTRKALVADKELRDLMLPSNLDCGFISEKRQRYQPPRKARKSHTSCVDCRYEKVNGETAPFILQLQLRHHTSDEYVVGDAAYFPDAECSTKYTGLALEGCRIRILDSDWSTRRESVAVDPLLFTAIQLFAMNATEITELDLRAAFPSLTVSR